MDKMKLYFSIGLRIIRRFLRTCACCITWFQVKIMLLTNNVNYKSIHSNGLPYFCVGVKACCRIGYNLNLNNGLRFNPIGFPQPCTIYVADDAELIIGDNVGISQASIICHRRIEIQDNVKIGGGTKIYDTDFHSLDFKHRRSYKLDMANKKSASVIIEHDAFIGAGVMILKGVKIGACAVVGAGSVVTKDIPPFQIWAGNPARFIRNI